MSKNRDWRTVQVPKPLEKSKTLCVEDGCTKKRYARKRCMTCYTLLRKSAVLGRIYLTFEIVEQLFRERAPTTIEEFSDVLGVHPNATRRWIGRLVGAEVAVVAGRTAEGGPQVKGSRTLYGVLKGPTDEEYRTAADRLLEGGGTQEPELVPVEVARAQWEAVRRVRGES